MKKSVIAVPRRGEYNEHIDEHQLQISGVLSDEGYLRQVINIKDLGDMIEECKENPITKMYNRTSNVMNIINEFIQKEQKKK